MLQREGDEPGTTRTHANARERITKTQTLDNLRGKLHTTRTREGGARGPTTISGVG